MLLNSPNNSNNVTYTYWMFPLWEAVMGEKELRRDMEALINKSKGKATTGIVLQYVYLKNSVGISVAKWAYGVSFREDPNNLVKERGSVAPHSTDSDPVNIDKCTFIKVCHVWMSDGGVLESGPTTLPDGQCYSVVGWEITPRPGVMKKDGTAVLQLNPIEASGGGDIVGNG
jgi:hypothetical protein